MEINGAFTVNNFNFADVGRILGDDTILIDGGAAISGDFMRIQNSSNHITLANGSITMSDGNAFRSNGASFSGYINFTGAAGSATVTQTGYGSNGQTLAGKFRAGGANVGYFAIGGVQINSGVAYDGTNIGDVNADLALAANTVGGLYFQIAETGTVGGGDISHTLSLVPEPSSYALLAGLLGLSYVMTRRRK